jgi:hypothetical protein
MGARNAILLISPHHMRDSDFHEIARRARALDPALKAYVAINGRRNRTARWAQILRPTLQVELEPVERFPLWRGRKLESVIRPKQVTLGLLRDRGLPVPDFVELAPDTRLDPAQWGDYVVVKPAYGRRGAFVWIHRTERVRHKPRESYPEDHPGRLGPMLAQRFIHTGPWPVSYRVLSFLGEPLIAVRYELNHGQPPLQSPADFATGRSINIVASGKRSRISACHEADLMVLARRIHEALPERPVLGIDLIREAASGRLYVSEVNERYCWTLSNESGQQIQAQFGFSLYREFDPLPRAAAALVRAARALAR